VQMELHLSFLTFLIKEDEEAVTKKLVKTESGRERFRIHEEGKGPTTIDLLDTSVSFEYIFNGQLAYIATG